MSATNQKEIALQVWQCGEDQAQSWDDFVQQNPLGIHYHLYGWKSALEKAYGHESIYLAAGREGKIEGILPLVVIKSKIFGNSITSLPFIDITGIAANSPEGEQVLLQAAIDLAKQRQVNHLELRQSKLISGDLEAASHKVSLILALKQSAEEQWKMLPSERRNRIRKAESAGLQVVLGGKEFLPEFYPAWTRNMRDLGSPAHSYGFFESVLDAFPNSSCVLLVKQGEKVIGGAVALQFKDTLMVPWVSSVKEYLKYYPNVLLYWEAIKLSISRGLKSFDFGRSSVDSGTYTFKIRWGAIPKPLYWEFVVFDQSHPMTSSSDNPKYSIAIEIWKRLPLSIANYIGPKIRKSITA